MWPLVSIIGLAAGKHFLDDRDSIHTELLSREAYATVKRNARAVVLDNIATYKDLSWELLDAKAPQRIQEIVEELGALETGFDLDVIDFETKQEILNIIAQHKTAQQTLQPAETPSDAAPP